MGRDGLSLLQACQQPQAPQTVRELPQIQLLQQVWQQHYEEVDDQIRWRDGPAVANAQRVVSPYDPDARSSRKRETEWVGDIRHMTETCDEDPNALHLIVHVETTPATTADEEVLAPLLEKERQQGLAPEEMYLDMGSTRAEQLVEQACLGTRLIGPVAGTTTWQQRQQNGFAPQDFQLDWQEQVAICPQGQRSQSWRQSHDKRGKPTTVIREALAVCEACPVRASCTHSQEGRTLTLGREPSQLALEQRRKEQVTPAFQQKYARRAGIEATISQAVRTTGLRQARVRGQDKVHVQHVQIAAAINCMRIDSWLLAQQKELPARRSRPRSPFARLQEREAG